MSALSRPEAVERLARLGITGTDVYLLDFLPLIEMMWADGLVQSREQTLFDAFVAEHVEAINTMAGLPIVSIDEARRFAGRFLDARPDDRLMDELRALIPPVRLGSSDAAGNDARREAIIGWCLDIAAACVTEYPYGDRERFKASEKQRLYQIVRSLGPSRA